MPPPCRPAVLRDALREAGVRPDATQESLQRLVFMLLAPHRRCEGAAEPMDLHAAARAAERARDIADAVRESGDTGSKLRSSYGAGDYA